MSAAAAAWNRKGVRQELAVEEDVVSRRVGGPGLRLGLGPRKCEDIERGAAGIISARHDQIYVRSVQGLVQVLGLDLYRNGSKEFDGRGNRVKGRDGSYEVEKFDCSPWRGQSGQFGASLQAPL